MTSTTKKLSKAAQLFENEEIDVTLAYTTFKTAMLKLRGRGKRLGHVVNPQHGDRVRSKTAHLVGVQRAADAAAHLGLLSRGECETTGQAAVDEFVDRLAMIGGKIGVFLTHNYAIGVCRPEDLVDIDRALFDAIKSRFPDTTLTQVFAQTAYARHMEDSDKQAHFENAVFEASRAEIVRLGAIKGTNRRAGTDRITGIPFIRGEGLMGTELVNSHSLRDPMSGSFTNEVSFIVGESIYMHAALIIDTKTEAADDDEVDNGCDENSSCED